MGKDTRVDLFARGYEIIESTPSSTESNWPDAAVRLKSV